MSSSSIGFQGSLPPIEPGQPHVPCVLLVDISGSMSGAPLNELKKGLHIFGETIKEDDVAIRRADVCVFAFNSIVNLVIPFMPAKEFYVPNLDTSGVTAMNQAIICGLDALAARRSEYRAHGIPSYKPWLFLLTDGLATDDEYEYEAKRRLNEMFDEKKLYFFPMGIGRSVDYNKLGSYCGERGYYMKASKENFKDAFRWLSSSLSAVSHSTPGEVVNLPNTSNDIQFIQLPSS